MSIDRKINRIQFLTGNSLKFIAVLTMVIDHLCKIVLQWLLSNYWGAMVDNEQMEYIFSLSEVQRAVRHMAITHTNQANREKELKADGTISSERHAD